MYSINLGRNGKFYIHTVFCMYVIIVYKKIFILFFPFSMTLSTRHLLSLLRCHNFNFQTPLGVRLAALHHTSTPDQRNIIIKSRRGRSPVFRLQFILASEKMSLLASRLLSYPASVLLFTPSCKISRHRTKDRFLRQTAFCVSMLTTFIFALPIMILKLQS